MNDQANTFNDSEINSRLDQLVEQLDPVLKHITPHRFLWGFTLVCAFVAWNRGLMLLYGLVALLLAVIIVSHIMRLINLRGLDITAEFISEQGVISPTHNEVFTDEPVGIKIDTYSKLSKHFLHLHIPAFKVVYGTEEQQYPVDEANLFILNCKGQDEFIHELTLKRGVYRLQTADVSCAYPFGLLNTHKSYEFNQSTEQDPIPDLYVLPTWFEIKNLPLDSANSQGQDQLKSKKRGGHDEIVDIRPYRRGDAFKTVHWGASARQVSRGQDWVVKEYANYNTPKVLIVLNQFDLQNEQSLDAMISSALAVGEYFAKLGYQVNLYGYDGFSSSINEFWQIDINASMSGYLRNDKLRKLAEINGLSHSTSDIRRNRYEDALQAILAHEPTANVVMSFYAQSPSHISSTISTLLDNKTQYQVVISKKATLQTAYQKHTQWIHEYRLNPNDTLENLAQVFDAHGI